jgi:proteasome assembly chaperone (PAC2) family protein
VVQDVKWDEQPRLRAPVLVAAFEGWNDAGDAASTAVRHLASAWSGHPFASLDPEEFYDFTATRPQVRLVDGITRQVDWPQNEFSAAPLPGRSHDVVFLIGVEPQLHWRRFCTNVTGLAQELGVELVVSLGALLADVPHTLPVRVTGTAADEDLVRRLSLERSRYEGPTGIVGVLHDTFRKQGIPSASLWAAVPHYVAQTPSPKATLALVQKAAGLLGASVQTTDLEIASAAYERQVSEVVAGDDDVADYVRRLEEAYEEGDREPRLQMLSGDALADEVERYLRDQGS